MKNFIDFLTESLDQRVNEAVRGGNYNVVEFDSPTKFSVYLGLDYEDYLYLSDADAKFGVGVKHGKWDNRTYVGDVRAGDGGLIIVIRKNNDIADCIMDVATDMNDFKSQMKDDIIRSFDTGNTENILDIVMRGLNISRVEDLPSYKSKNPGRILNAILKIMDTQKATDKDAIAVLDPRGMYRGEVYGKKAFEIYDWSRAQFSRMRAENQAGLMEYPDYAKEYADDYESFCRRYEI